MGDDKRLLDKGPAGATAPTTKREKALKAYRAESERHKPDLPLRPLPVATAEDEVLLEDLLDSSRKAA